MGLKDRLVDYMDSFFNYFGLDPLISLNVLYIIMLIYFRNDFKNFKKMDFPTRYNRIAVLTAGIALTIASVLKQFIK